GPRPRRLVGLSLAMTLGVLSKYTALVVLPMAVAGLGAAAWLRLAPGRRAHALALAAVLPLPLAAVTWFAAPNMAAYGRPFPSNLELLQADWLASGEGALDLSFLGFRPWTTVQAPILAPVNRTELWSVVAAGMWFDVEPLYLP